MRVRRWVIRLWSGLRSIAWWYYAVAVALVTCDSYQYLRTHAGVAGGGLDVRGAVLQGLIRFLILGVALLGPFGLELRREASTFWMRLLLERLLRDFGQLRLGTSRRMRANVMLLTGRGNGRFLKISRFAERYSEEELALTYAPGQGPWGHALVSREVLACDVAHQDFTMPLTAWQMHVLSKSASVISVPIEITYADGSEPERLGVLNVESELPLLLSGLSSDEAVRCAVAYAEEMAIILAGSGGR